MGKWTEQDIPDLSRKRILVTGAGSGIGYEAARALAQHGAEVLIADRNELAGRASVANIRALRPDARVRFLALDLSCLQAVKDFGAALVARGKPLDVLINNAGINSIVERQLSVDGYELTFAIGHLGHFALTGLLLPLLNAATAPRVVTVSSMVHGHGRFDWNDLQMAHRYTSQRAYNQTKLANLLFAREFQRRMDRAGGKIKSIAVHPGVARTAIGANRRNLGQFNLADHLVTAVLSLVMPFLGQPAAAGALPTLYAAVSPDAAAGGFYGPDGFGEMKGAPKPASVKPAARDTAAGEKLWQLTERITGVRYRS
ncbi:MAG: SDR family oxidoreductase [Steroidobacteraceae bacterium]|nr:SDR family oxidoreductase [Pseudomonadota bacterium]MBP6107878.1 SDR family oxidoreductase [Steroidobacteraceae bacterium]MBP7015229.1 SDR family oxidoreductase [Steroidobacteraceae bacterium]